MGCLQSTHQMFLTSGAQPQEHKDNLMNCYQWTMGVFFPRKKMSLMIIFLEIKHPEKVR